MKAHYRARFWLKLLATITTTLLAAAGAINGAWAHEHREVGPYEFEVGFAVEPALEGQKNGVSLSVSHHDTEAPVEGVAETLQVEVTHLPTEVAKTFDLRPVFGEPGHYVADLIPTAPGQYSFRFFGTVEELAVDELFESGAETFDDVEPDTELEFPEPLPSIREVEGATRGALSAGQDAVVAATQARNIGLAGLVLAAIATGIGLVGLFRARR